MNTPLDAELRASLEDLGLPGNHKEMIGSLAKSPGGRKLRAHFLEQEKQEGNAKITQGPFWEISRKHRFDLLDHDMPIIADELAFSLAYSNLYIPSASQGNVSFSTLSNALRSACYHMDFGFRLASSGWNRLALLLDLAFELQLTTRCNFRNVIGNLSKPPNLVAENPDFVWLKGFGEGSFIELEAYPLGIRHEAAHRFSLLNRYHFEQLESYSPKAQRQELTEWHNLLLTHYYFYIKGVEHSVALINSAPLVPADS